jgi:hypothetical protein
MEDVNSRSVRYDDTWIRTVGWCFASKHEGSGTAIFLQGDSLTAVRLRPEGITLGDTVQAFGEPALFAARGSLGEVRQRSVQFLYPEKGIMISANDFGHWAPQGGKERLEEIMPVSWLLFFDPPVFDDRDPFARLMGYSTDAPLLEYLQPWQGFGLVPFSNGAR